MPLELHDLHVGKRTEEIKTLTTPQMHDLLVEKARAARCTPSELLHDVVFLVLTGMTFTDHVANDRRAALCGEGRLQGDFKAFDGLGASAQEAAHG